MKARNIYCDGSCKDNGRKNAIGGWGFIVTEDNTELIMEFGKLRKGTQNNNRAELEGMVQALIYVDNCKEDCQFTIFCDSEIVVNGINGIAKREANRDLWEDIESLCARNLGRFDVKHIESDKANNTDIHNMFNNTADKLAKQGANSLLIAPVQIII